MQITLKQIDSNNLRLNDFMSTSLAILIPILQTTTLFQFHYVFNELEVKQRIMNF